MMRNFKGLTVCSCLAFALFYGDCWGMKRSKSAEVLNRKKLVVYGDGYQGLQRRRSSPVTREEISEAESQHSETRLSVSDFLKTSESKTQEYDDVEFDNVKIDETFAASFAWKLKDSVDLAFNSCNCVGGTTYKDLFASTDVANLRMDSCGLTSDEAIYIICNLYPWTLSSITFTNETCIDKKLVIDGVMQRSALPLSAIAFN